MQVVLGLNPLSPFLAGTFCHEHLAERTLRAGFWEVKPSAFIYSEHQRDIYIYIHSSGRAPGRRGSKYPKTFTQLWQAHEILQGGESREDLYKVRNCHQLCVAGRIGPKRRL